MPLDATAKNRFVKKMVRDMTQKIPNPSKEVRDGMQEYAEDLCDSIIELIKSSTVWDTVNGSDTVFRVR